MKLCHAEQLPSRRVKLKVFSNAKQILSQIDIKSQAQMTAEPNEPKVGESFAEKQILSFQITAHQCSIANLCVEGNLDLKSNIDI